MNVSCIKKQVKIKNISCSSFQKYLSSFHRGVSKMFPSSLFLFSLPVYLTKCKMLLQAILIESRYSSIFDFLFVCYSIRVSVTTYCSVPIGSIFLGKQVSNYWELLDVVLLD
uniref:Uncharacterized protein n=1 Tax=Cacopsylla melanoneura TaxID=428564 RepID=A0A8D8QFI9_9HEMI